MKLAIEKIKTSNLRCPDFEIKLDDGINFLQIPNGVGKTTMLELIKNTLSNNWDQKKIAALQQKKDIYKDLPSHMSSEGSFSLDLKINDKEYYGFEVKFDFEEGKHTYITKSARGSDDRYAPPEAIRACLSPEHIDIFCFSADQLKPYFETTDRKVKNAVGTFTGANKLSKIYKLLEEEFQKKFEGERRTGTKKYGEKIKKLEEIIKRLETEKEEIDKKLNEINPALLKVTEDIINQEKKFADYTKDKEELETRVSMLQEETLVTQGNIAENMKNPLFFSGTLRNDFDQFLKNVKVKDIPGHSAKFFDFLSDEDDCICGRPLGEKEKKEIQKNKEKFLSHEDHNMASAIINEIEKASKFNKSGKDLVDKLNTLESDLQRAKQDLNDFIETNSSRLKIEEKLRKQDSLQDEKNKLEQDLRDITNSRYEDKKQQERKVIGAIITDYENEFRSLEDAKALRTILRRKEASAGQYKEAFEIMEQFKEAIKESIQEANDEIYEEIQDNMNAKIRQVFGSQQIKVEEISNCIKLQGSDDGGSGAENTVSVTSFALALLERSSVGFPMIIDHPVIGVDTTPRKHLSKFLNNLDVQTICFVITSEVPGFVKVGRTNEFHEYLENGNFATLSRLSKVNAVYREEDLPSDHVKTNDGFISTDKEFFQNFDTEKMEED